MSITTVSLLWKQAGTRACKLTIGQIVKGIIAVLQLGGGRRGSTWNNMPAIPYFKYPSGNEDAGVDRIILFATLGALFVAACFRAGFLRPPTSEVIAPAHEPNDGKIRKR
ncbi:hypothetical protein F5J12DRAFT_782679 [Pisolithus orientalis]|uniref:uncharacterized protein n=1 Tax=Pisolithus orientalis TaxID=936130 RepID=UPI00222430E7|nr:uncharacterized protein F5J12DRAFT_782679 [Pisolithus orientalis]KAI6007668.1 hypothetical protein F5J12DRAFT_782679 [Pisolithus orientalis]